MGHNVSDTVTLPHSFGITDVWLYRIVLPITLPVVYQRLTSGMKANGMLIVTLKLKSCVLGSFY